VGTFSNKFWIGGYLHRNEGFQPTAFTIASDLPVVLHGMGFVGRSRGTVPGRSYLELSAHSSIDLNRVSLGHRLYDLSKLRIFTKRQSSRVYLVLMAEKISGRSGCHRKEWRVNYWSQTIGRSIRLLGGP